jgi:hypothetical protein
MSYNALRDRHGSSVGGAPIGFVKSGPDEYRSRDDLWAVTHFYKTGYQAHHEWRVTAPDGTRWAQRTYRYYCTLSDAVEAINAAVAYGPIIMLLNLYKRLNEAERERERDEAAAKLRAEREVAVLVVLRDHNINNSIPIASQIVDRLFGMET